MGWRNSPDNSVSGVLPVALPLRPYEACTWDHSPHSFHDSRRWTGCHDPKAEKGRAAVQLSDQPWTEEKSPESEKENNYFHAREEEEDSGCR